MNTIINQGAMLPMKCILRGIYRIERYLSSGGFGNTYVATNIEFEETVAIKEFFIRGVTHRDANNTTVSVSNSENQLLFDEQLQKFKKEARRLRKLRNEHIVTVHDLFEENGTAYYVMDYIDGENLSDKVKRQGFPLDEDVVMSHYLPQILDALDSVHKKGLWHLDLKPANIMVDRNGKVCLIDFGASKQRSSSGGATSSTGVSYTKGYAPREQMEQSTDKFGPWTDIYALGATLYNLLAFKRPPMPSDIDDDRTADKHLALPMPDTISEKTKQLILKMLTTDRFSRPQSVKEVMDLIAQAPQKPQKPQDSQGSLPAEDSQDSLPTEDSETLQPPQDTQYPEDEEKSISIYPVEEEEENDVEVIAVENAPVNREAQQAHQRVVPEARNNHNNQNNHKNDEPEEKTPLWKKYLVPVIAAVAVAAIIIAVFHGKKDDGVIAKNEPTVTDTMRKAEPEPQKVVEKKTVKEMKYTKNTIGEFTYTGEVDDNNTPNGQGKAVFANGDIYEGPFKDGMFHGQNAKYQYKSGEIITGQVENNQFVKGRITYSKDEYFEGTIKNNEPVNGIMRKNGKDIQVKNGREIN